MLGCYIVYTYSGDFVVLRRQNSQEWSLSELINLYYCNHHYLFTCVYSFIRLCRL